MRTRTKTPIRLDQAVSGILLRLGGLAAIAVFVAVGVNVARTVISQSADRYIAASQALSEAHAGMLDEETGLRGFLETGVPSFLDPYHLGQDELVQGNAQLQQAVGGDAGLLDGYVAVRLSQGAWLSGWADDAVAQQPRADGIAAFLTSGRALFETYRTAESRLITAIDAGIQRAQDSSSAIATGGVVVEVGVGLAGGLLWWRQLRALRRAVVGPVARILRTLEDIAGGNYAQPDVVHAGPAELQDVLGRLSGIAAKLHAAHEGMQHGEDEAAGHAARLRGIVDMGREIAGSLNLRYVLEAVSHSVVANGCGTRCVIWLTDEGRDTLTATYDSAGLKGRVAGLASLDVAEQAMGKAARFGRIVGPEPVSHPGVAEPWSHAIAVPMVVGARVVGVIEAGADHPIELSTVDMELIDTLSSQAATAIEAARLYERAEEMGRTDALTLLPNRRDLDATMASEVARASRYRRSMAVAMLDLDHFKLVNDSFGHARGDEVLQQVAAVMRSVLRDVDTIYRYGGEEFLVLMPETDCDSGVEMCDRLREAVTTRVTLPDGRHPTLSGGVAAFPVQADNPAGLIAAADAALYRAKSAGRDCVIAAQPQPGGAADPPRLVPSSA
jgi:diguanylate cyclase (GGDEF)-like protein